MKGFINVTHRDSGMPLVIATHAICVIAPAGRDKKMATLTLSVPFNSDGSLDLAVSDSYEDLLKRLEEAQ